MSRTSISNPQATLSVGSKRGGSRDDHGLETMGFVERSENSL